MAADPVETVHAWHAALNAGNPEHLVALSSDDVEIGGPRGSTRGGQLLREWFARARVSLEPMRTFHRDETVVVEQRATWQVPEAHTGTDSQTVASVFFVQDGQVTSVIRHADLASALEAGGLASADEV